MIYNVSMKIAHLLENQQAAAIFDQFLPGMRKMAEGNPQAALLSVEQLVRSTRNPKAKEVLLAMNEALIALNTPENAILDAVFHLQRTDGEKRSPACESICMRGSHDDLKFIF